MYVKVSKVAGKEYVQICHSVRIKGTNKTKQVVIEKLGLLSKLQEENPNILEDLKINIKVWEMKREIMNYWSIEFTNLLMLYLTQNSMKGMNSKTN
ncbi:hypothetical protein NPA07_01105 [Mycoplasmopsis caviae]|uniref:Transposase n=1 Tax=Mycoplasmopsis caviae TaxID=55603 RepID=A0ABY5J065_9BACT|nr:hypothetical protein [Mycoplasmopsis caviae]UUD35456.1 hypothetical protein NPA07_01105 [Mycoplasmopsis caviae]